MVRHVRPAPPLGRFVDCLWYLDGVAGSHMRERALPTGAMDLVVDLSASAVRLFRSETDLAGSTFRGPVLCGAHSEYFVIESARGQMVLGAHFKPGGAAPFLGAPAGEFAAANFSLEDIWPPSEARRLHQRLLEAPSPDARLALLENVLLRRLSKARLPHPAAEHALLRLSANPSVLRIAELRDATGYSAKLFIRLFRDACGFSPKVFARIQRFQKVIARLGGGHRVEWADVALEGGYYDQPHLNREFRAFSGVSPGDYRPVAPDRLNHSAIP